MNSEVFWQYNEFIQAGADYVDEKRAAAYDEMMGKIRNQKERAKEMIELLSLDKNDTVIDFGCGTGTLTIEIARKCRKMIGVDISTAMLEIAAKKAKEENLFNIDFHNAGFLTYEHKGEPVDKVLTSGAFHHLPDFWKVISLQRMHDMLKDGGLLLLSDVVFSFDPKEYINEINAFLDFINVKAGEALYNDGILHIKEEFSTFDWLLDEMLKRTGFEIVRKVASSKTNIDYVCKKRDK